MPESYPAFHPDELSLFLVTHFCFNVGRLFITLCIRRAVFYSTYPKCPRERMPPVCFSTKARTWESAQMTIKRNYWEFGLSHTTSRQNNFKGHKTNTISFCCTVGIIHYQHGFVVAELCVSAEHQQHDRNVSAFLFCFYKRECNRKPQWQLLPRTLVLNQPGTVGTAWCPRRSRVSQHLLAASFDSPATAQTQCRMLQRISSIKNRQKKYYPKQRSIRYSEGFFCCTFWFL